MNYLRTAMFALAALFVIAFGPAPAAAAEPAFVTFSYDDCAKSQERWALPLLDKYGFDATFFIPTAYLGADPWCMKPALLSWHAEGDASGARVPYQTRVLQVQGILI